MDKRNGGGSGDMSIINKGILLHQHSTASVKAFQLGDRVFFTKHYTNRYFVEESFEAYEEIRDNDDDEFLVETRKREFRFSQPNEKGLVIGFRRVCLKWKVVIEDHEDGWPNRGEYIRTEGKQIWMLAVVTNPLKKHIYVSPDDADLTKMEEETRWKQ
jgi:hypothetical protein